MFPNKQRKGSYGPFAHYLPICKIGRQCPACDLANPQNGEPPNAKGNELTQIQFVSGGQPTPHAPAQEGEIKIEQQRVEY